MGYVRGRAGGFSLTELLVTLAVLAVLVGLVGTGSGGSVEREKVGRILRLVVRLEDACARYHEDTGRLAYEYTNYEDPHKKLTAAQEVPGWDGPYLEEPLQHHESNPYGSLHLYSDPRVNGWIPGFDLDADGTVEVADDANMLWLSGIDEVSARDLDEALDDELGRGVRGSWRESGRVRYDGRQRYAWVFLHR